MGGDSSNLFPNQWSVFTSSQSKFLHHMEKEWSHAIFMQPHGALYFASCTSLPFGLQRANQKNIIIIIIIIITQGNSIENEWLICPSSSLKGPHSKNEPSTQLRDPVLTFIHWRSQGRKKNFWMSCVRIYRWMQDGSNMPNFSIQFQAVDRSKCSLV